MTQSGGLLGTPRRLGSTSSLPTGNTALSSTAEFNGSKLTPYLQVLAGHLVVFNTFGYIGSWGFLEAYYTAALDYSRSDISWIGSIQIFLVYFVGAFSGRALDAGYLRFTLTVGFVLQVLGIFATSWTKTYWQLFLSEGLCVGLGDGLVFCPMISLISTWYTEKYRTLAVAFAACGAASGGMVFPSIAKELLGRIGVSWTLRIFGFIFLANSLVVLSLVRVRVEPRKTGPLFEFAAFKETPYLLFCVGAFFSLLGVYFAYYYISIFGTTILNISQQRSFYLILAINAIGFLGRLLPAWLVPKVGGVLNVFIPVVFAAGFLLFMWAFVTNAPGLIAFIVFYGFFANAVQAMFVGGVGSLVKDKQKMGSRIGMVFTVVSFACLSGPPIAGALIDLRHGTFLYAQMFGGATMVFGSIFLIGAYIAKHRIDKMSAL